jgi:hypothetical protein
MLNNACGLNKWEKKLVRLTDKEWKKAVKSGNEKQLVVRLFSDKMTEI